MQSIYHSFTELPSLDKTKEAIGYTTDGQPEAEGAEPNFNDDDGECTALYQKFTDEKHPRNRWDMALWACSFNDWKSGCGSRYRGPYADRTSEMYALHDAFIEEYIEARNRSGWKKEDGSEIEYPLVDVLDAYEAWRRKEFAKPDAERVCDFGSNGFPLSLGQFAAFIEAVNGGTDCYFDDRLDDMHIYYDRLALRGLVPDERHVRDLPPSVADNDGLCVRLAGIENDEELLPPNIVQYLMARQRANGFTRLHEEDEEETVAWMREESEKLDGTKMFFPEEQILFPSYRAIRSEDRLAARKIVGTDGDERKARIRNYVTGGQTDSEWKPANRLQVAYCLASHMDAHETDESEFREALNIYNSGALLDYLADEKNLGRGFPKSDPIFSMVHAILEWRPDAFERRPDDVAGREDENKAIMAVASRFAGALIDSEGLYHAYDMLAFRGLAPDFSGVRELDWATAYEKGFHLNAFALKDDAKLLPPAFVDYVLDRKRGEGLPAALDGATDLRMRTFREIGETRRRKADGNGRGRERHPEYYRTSAHAYERVKPVWTLDGESLRKALEPLEEDREAQAEYVVGKPATYRRFWAAHHPTNPFQLALWHVNSFCVDNGRLVYGGPEPERPAGLGLLNDEFIDWYFGMMDACNWSEEDGSPIDDPEAHLLDSFDWWRRGPGKDLMGDDGFPREHGRYNDYLYFAWKTIGWDFKDGCETTADVRLAFDNLAAMGLVPYFSRGTKKAVSEVRGESLPFHVASDAGCAEKEAYRAGFPVPYADFTPEHHPTSPLHIAFWLAHHNLHAYSRGDYPDYGGPYACRVGEFRKMHYAFVREYLSRMEASGWKNPDGSRISDALKHIIDSFEDWRERETAKPPEERACEFGEDGFPVDAGAFEPFLELADDCVSYLMDGGTQEYLHCVDLYAKLAFRGLVWDANHLRELPFWEIRKYPFHRKLKGVGNDEELFPPKYAKRLMVLREFEEEVERKKARIPSAEDGKDGQPGVATPDEGKEDK